MAGEAQSAASIFDVKWPAGAIALALLVMFAATIIAAPAVQAQTFSVLYNFTGGADGYAPYAGVSIAPSEFSTERRHSVEPIATAQFSS